EVVLTGDEIDLSRLPFYLQHEYDGGPYISSAIDYSQDPATGRCNVGCRRLMLRSRRTLRSTISRSRLTSSARTRRAWPGASACR
ncbi:MAG: UbiD family decarboxylase domain-containing protein, partial [Trebonia sp.]